MTIRDLFELKCGDRVKIDLLGPQTRETGTVVTMHDYGVVVRWDRENHNQPQPPDSLFEAREFQNETPMRNIADLEKM